LARHRPRILLMFGLAARTPYLRIETRARNARSLLFPDVAGGVSARMAIAPGKASALRGVAPFPALLAACRQARVPVRLSRDAGRYLCNYLYWRALDADPSARPDLIVFVHVPKIRRPPRRLRRQKAVTAGDLVRAGDAVLRVLAAAARGARR
jgi:pyroglutamyl-peptidase